jgi:hypothetical protein
MQRPNGKFRPNPVIQRKLLNVLNVLLPDVRGYTVIDSPDPLHSFADRNACDNVWVQDGIILHKYGKTVYETVNNKLIFFIHKQALSPVTHYRSYKPPLDNNN